MKKFFGLFLAALAAIALCSCSNQASAQSAELGSEPVTITFWHSASDEAGVLVDKYVKEFNETNDKQITVEAVYQGQYSDAATLMKTVISAENYSELPNIMQLDATGKVDYYNSGRALTIDEAQERFGETIADGILTRSSPTGSTAARSSACPSPPPPPSPTATWICSPKPGGANARLHSRTSSSSPPT